MSGNGKVNGSKLKDEIESLLRAAVAQKTWRKELQCVCVCVCWKLSPDLSGDTQRTLRSPVDREKGQE